MFANACNVAAEKAAVCRWPPKNGSGIISRDFTPSIPMLSLIRFFFLLCLLRNRPQDLPASQALLMVVAAVNIVIGTIVVTPALGSPFTALLASLLDTAMLLGFVWLLLRFRDHPGRFLQTATAAVGVSAVIAILSLPLQWTISSGANTASPTPETATQLFLLLILWLQVALGHVLRHALGVNLLLGVGLAFLYAMVSGVVVQSLFLTPAGP